MKKDFRSIGQVYRDMHEAAIEKKAEKAVEKSLDKIDDPVEKLEALDGIVKQALAGVKEAVANSATLEYGSTTARDEYCKDTPGQSPGDPAHEPTHAMKAKYGLSVNGVPHKGGEMDKPDNNITTGLKVEGHESEPELVEAKDMKVKNCGCGMDPCKTYGSKEEQMKEEAEAKMPSKEQITKMCKAGKTTAEICKMHPDCDQDKLKAMIKECRSELDEATAVPGFMGADGKPTFKPTKKDMDSNKEYQGMKKKNIFKKGKLKGVDEAFAEAMSVTLRKSKSQPGSYKVHSVGSQMKKHGGIKPGERVKDHEIDSMHDSQIRVKYRKESKDEFEPHMMYDPKTGKGYKAETEADHIKYKKMGYGHDKPSMSEGKGLWANIHAKRARGEKMNPKGHKDAPTPAEMKKAQESVEVNEIDQKQTVDYINKTNKHITNIEKKHAAAGLSNVKDKKLEKMRTAVSTARGQLNKEMTEHQKGLIEAKYTDKQVRMAKGIAFDKRHYQGDYSGAAKKMEKIKKGLSNHPKAADALRRANEQKELAKELFGTELNELSKDTLSSYKDKANKQMPGLRDKMFQPMGKDNSNFKKNLGNLKKRRKGIETASAKMDQKEGYASKEAKAAMASNHKSPKKVMVNGKMMSWNKDKYKVKPIPGNPAYKGKQNPKMDEEAIKEISDATKKSYIKKAGENTKYYEKQRRLNRYSPSTAWRFKGRESDRDKPESDQISKYENDKIKKRQKGIQAAKASLKKEETVNELKKSTLGSYIKRAAGDAISKADQTQFHTSKMFQKQDDGDKKGAKKHAKAAKEPKRKTMNRFYGIQRAASKMDKNDTNKGEYLAHPMTKSKTSGKVKATESMTPNSHGYNVQQHAGELAKKDGKDIKKLPYGHAQGYRDKASAALKKSEAVERRADAKVIMVTDPNTGKRVAKNAPRRQIEIGLGKDA